MKSHDFITIQEAGAVPSGQPDIFILFLNPNASGWKNLVFNWYKLKSAGIEHFSEKLLQQMTFHMN